MALTDGDVDVVTGLCGAYVRDPNTANARRKAVEVVDAGVAADGSAVWVIVGLLPPKRI